MPFSKKMGKRKAWLAYKMRANPTEAERIFWTYASGTKLGYKFSRQKRILGYIIDFYCPEIALAIEIDGRIHDSARRKRHDKKRDDVLYEHGIKTLRFTNDDVLYDIHRTLKRVLGTCVSRSKTVTFPFSMKDESREIIRNARSVIAEIMGEVYP